MQGCSGVIVHPLVPTPAEHRFPVQLLFKSHISAVQFDNIVLHVISQVSSLSEDTVLCPQGSTV